MAGKSGTDNRLFSVAVNAGGRAVAVGAFGTILYSADGGMTWASIAPDWTSYTKDGEQPHLFDAAIDDKGAMTLVGEFGLILRSEDGKSWKTLHTGEASLFALDLRSDRIGYAVGQNGTVLKTGDGGNTWSNLNVGTTAILLGVRSTKDGKIIVSGMHDMLVSADDGRTWTHMPDKRFGSSWYQGVADSGPAQPWLVVGNAGQVLSISK
jgi:photosystem II stability/assembly factor-like uncharacterized protein